MAGLCCNVSPSAVSPSGLLTVGRLLFRSLFLSLFSLWLRLASRSFPLSQSRYFPFSLPPYPLSQQLILRPLTYWSPLCQTETRTERRGKREEEEKGKGKGGPPSSSSPLTSLVFLPLLLPVEHIVSDHTHYSVSISSHHYQHLCYIQTTVILDFFKHLLAENDCKSIKKFTRICNMYILWGFSDTILVRMNICDVTMSSALSIIRWAAYNGYPNNSTGVKFGRPHNPARNEEAPWMRGQTASSISICHKIPCNPAANALYLLLNKTFNKSFCQKC